MDKNSRMLLRNLIVGLVGFVPALALLLIALRVQDFLPSSYVYVLLFACPVPIASGFLVGLISPRKAVAWAPLWAAIFAILLFVLISGDMPGAGAAFSAARVAYMLAGGVIAALAACLGRWAASRGGVGRMAAGLVLVSCLMGYAGSVCMRGEMEAYQRDMQPQVLAEVDRDYIALPASLDWRCEALIRDHCYALRSKLSGQDILVLAEPDSPSLICVEYCRPGIRANLRTTAAARAYLKKIGLRDALIRDLSESKGGPKNWSSVLQATRLTLTPDGSVLITGVSLHGVSRASAP